MAFDLFREIMILPFYRAFMPHTVAVLFTAVFFGFSRSTLVPISLLLLFSVCAGLIESVTPDAYDTELFVLYVAGVLVYSMLTFAITRAFRNVFDLVQRTVWHK